VELTLREVPSDRSDEAKLAAGWSLAGEVKPEMMRKICLRRGIDLEVAMLERESQVKVGRRPSPCPAS
jgi:hypothetical protein